MSSSAAAGAKGNFAAPSDLATGYDVSEATIAAV